MINDPPTPDPGPGRDGCEAVPNQARNPDPEQKMPAPPGSIGGTKFTPPTMTVDLKPAGTVD